MEKYDSQKIKFAALIKASFYLERLKKRKNISKNCVSEKLKTTYVRSIFSNIKRKIQKDRKDILVSKNES